MAEPALYNKIGLGYNATRCADEYLVGRFRALLAPQENENYLDVGCGTGNYTCALSSGEFQFYGVEPSEMMLSQARQKNCQVIWQNGVAENLPFDDDFFSGAVASLTIHHWNNLQQAFGELSRVLNSGGKFVLFTSFPEQMESYWLNDYFPQMMRDSMRQMPPFSVVEQSLKAAGLKIKTRENYSIRDDLQDHFLYCGKNKPEMYLRQDVRKGISSFSSLANKDEIESGLRRLAEDIKEDRISETIRKYQSDRGDYAFIVAAKTA